MSDLTPKRIAELRALSDRAGGEAVTYTNEQLREMAADPMGLSKPLHSRDAVALAAELLSDRAQRDAARAELVAVKAENAKLRQYAPQPFDDSLPTYATLVRQLAETESELADFRQQLAAANECANALTGRAVNAEHDRDAARAECVMATHTCFGNPCPICFSVPAVDSMGVGRVEQNRDALRAELDGRRESSAKIEATARRLGVTCGGCLGCGTFDCSPSALLDAVVGQRDAAVRELENARGAMAAASLMARHGGSTMLLDGRADHLIPHVGRIVEQLAAVKADRDRLLAAAKAVVVIDCDPFAQGGLAAERSLRDAIHASEGGA